eukprot:CAMPEP_0113567332 /NCGR_PEP_ID=MMETSP0015_2-20120614/23218_1 /TAXON_ID=2838 /ORGANISM="Odontella" /LENGTH=157 /DNA_ID=CAMNT_0000469717 /DNA_START=147 /DNA_END=620 /DNA_ORIENTATION=+ /assembly_acc=CAM_ASM_000160
MSLSSMISIELLFWLPTIQDLLLLVFTYGSFALKGYEWYFEWIDAAEKGNHKKDDGDGEGNTAVNRELSSFGKKRVQAVWELAMMAYSAYGILLPLATFWCYKYPELRVDFCWAMTALMVVKVISLLGKNAKTELGSLFFFYFPTYGGYAVAKTFFL